MSLFHPQFDSILSSIASTECGEIPSSTNPGIFGDDTVSICIGLASTPTMRYLESLRSNAPKFRCPTCDAEYRVVRVEAPPTHDNPLLCLGCGGRLQNRDGRFALKYFRKSGSNSMNGHKPRLR